MAKAPLLQSGNRGFESRLVYVIKPGEQGRLGEAKVVAYFVENGYSVYHPLFGNTSFDMIIEKNRECYHIQVKSTRNVSPSGNHLVKLYTMYNTVHKNVQKNFDSTGVDYIAVYIVSEDRVVVLEAKEYEGRNAVTIKREDKPVRATGTDC